MAKITVSPDYNLQLIAERAGESDPEKRLYEEGKLHVEGITQEALETALSGYNNAIDGLKPADEMPDKVDVLESALKDKGILNDSDITTATNRIMGV